MSRIINRRYILGEPLGKGGMGEVYRALDRLTGNMVALKRVSSILDLPDSSIKPEDLRLALAQEFESLASLRHPNIIGVSDYGFDEERQPYFTMEYLENARTICEAGHRQPLPVQIDLLAQMLRALAYIHRRGILHRDLKPGNVLVIERGGATIVKVLDFGLAAEITRAHGLSGTVAYIAPERISGAAPITYATDLYSVGVIGYEMVTGNFPFNDATPNTLMRHVMNTPIDLDVVPLELRMLIGWLLAKLPEDRYASAEAVINALGNIVGTEIPVDTPVTRESFLQASRFVGREKELAGLVAALDEAGQGRGSMFLVGGESGVGKTRLVDELSTRALVNGALVMRGYLSEQGGPAYELWREPLRRLVLGAGLTPLEISVLRTVAPDIESLVEVEALPGDDEQPTAQLTGEPARQRLYATIIEMFRRRDGTMLLILEDLHWGVESLELLKGLMAADLPILIVGTYRDDEMPDLPDLLPAAQVIDLERLTTDEIATLAGSMLGQQRKEIINLLERETEGNVYFLVETVRALAEEAGDLGSVGRITLPRHVLAGGVQAIIRRRLSRVPAWGQPLLKIAAVTGRQIDFAMLSWLAELNAVVDVESWVIATSNAAVGEVEGEVWRFAHDKLRQAALAELEAAERQGLHHQVAVTIETLYPESTNHIEELIYHWREAGDTSRETKYLIQGAEQAITLTAIYPQALTWLRRALDRLDAMPDDPRRGKVLNLLGKTHYLLGEMDQAQAYFNWALMFGTPDVEAAAWIGLAEVEIRRGELANAEAHAEIGLAHYRSTGDQSGIADALQILASADIEAGSYPKAVLHLAEALELRRALGDQPGLGMCHNMLGNVNLYLGDYASARQHYDDSLRIRRALGDLRGMSATFNNLALIAQDMAEYDAAWKFHEQSLSLKQRINDRHGIEVSLGNLGYLAQLKGDLDLAERLYMDAVALQREIDDRRGMATTYADLAVIAMNKDQDDLAAAYFEESRRLKVEVQDRQGETVYYLNHSLFQLVRGSARDAAGLCGVALRIAQELGEPFLEGNCLLYAGEIAEVEGDFPAALASLERASEIFGEMKLPREGAHTFMSLARIWAAQGGILDALNALREAASIVARLNVPGDQLRLLITAAHVEWRRGDNAAAAALIGLAQAQRLTERADRFLLARLRQAMDAAGAWAGQRAAYEAGKTRDLNAEIARLQTIT